MSGRRSEGFRVPTISEINDEPRVLDTELAQALGFERPVNVRNLIGRHRTALEEFGPLFTVERVVNGGKAKENYLNQEQALYIVTKSETPNAVALTIGIVKRSEREPLTASEAGCNIITNVR